MLIDWFTIGAQALNFLVLVWLLRRFLYVPILNAIDARELRIASELADADARKAEAAKERDDFRQKNETFNQQRAALLSQATDAAEAERKRLTDAARLAANAMTTKRQEALQDEARHLKLALTRRAQQEVFAIARRVLQDLAIESLEQRMVGVFIQRLQALDAAKKTVLAQALQRAATPVRVRTAFELPEAQRVALQSAVDENLLPGKLLRYETAPDLVSGIELSANGEKLAWSIDDYLSTLEKSVCELLKECDDGAPPSGAAPAVDSAPK